MSPYGRSTVERHRCRTYAVGLHFVHELHESNRALQDLLTPVPVKFRMPITKRPPRRLLINQKKHLRRPCFRRVCVRTGRFALERVEGRLHVEEQIRLPLPDMSIPPTILNISLLSPACKDGIDIHVGTESD